MTCLSETDLRLMAGLRPPTCFWDVLINLLIARVIEAKYSWWGGDLIVCPSGLIIRDMGRWN